MMFPNQINPKEFFNTNPGQYLGNRADSDSAFSSSQSQFVMNSQSMDLDERSSQSQQDYSQQMFSNSANPNSPTDKKFYQLYMSKPPLTFGRKDSRREKTALQSSNKVTYQQQMQLNKARAKENDERDILDSIFTTVKKCTQEISGAVETIKENIDTNLQSKDDKIEQYIIELKDDVKASMNNVISTLKERDEHKDKLKDMEKELVEKETMLKYMQTQIAVMEKDREEVLVTRLTDAYKDQQDELRKQLNDLHKDHLNIVKTQQTLEKTQLAGFKNQAMLLDNGERDHRSGMEDMEKRIDMEIKGQQKTGKQQLAETMKQQLQQIKNLHNKQKKELLQEITNDLRTDFNTGINCDDISHSCEQMLYKLYSKQKLDLEGLIARQIDKLNGDHRQLHNHIAKSLQESHGSSQNDIITQVKKHNESTQIVMRQVFETQYNQLKQQIQSDIKHYLSYSDRIKAQDRNSDNPSRNDDIPRFSHNFSSLATDMDDTKSRYKMIPSPPPSIVQPHSTNNYRGTDASRQFRVTETIEQDQASVFSSEQDVYAAKPTVINDTYKAPSELICEKDKHTSENEKQKHVWKFSNNFISPTRNWTSRSLFCRPSPSPVATVLPQAKVADLQSKHQTTTAIYSTTEEPVCQDTNKEDLHSVFTGNAMHAVTTIDIENQNDNEGNLRTPVLPRTKMETHKSSNRKRGRNNNWTKSKKRRQPSSGTVSAPCTPADQQISMDVGTDIEHKNPASIFDFPDEDEHEHTNLTNATVKNGSSVMSNMALNSARETLRRQRSWSLSDISNKRSGMATLKKHSSFNCGSPENLSSINLDQSDKSSKESSPALSLCELVIRRRTKRKV